MSIWKYANPTQFMRTTRWLLPWLTALAVVSVGTGLIWGFFFTPDDFHHVSARLARAAALVGLVMTLIALITGGIWGEPMWGTYWAWDPRLTSFLILFLFYLGYIALWQAVETQDTAADLTSVLCLVGSVFALLSRYAVNFWNQGLHQGTSVPVATGGRTVSDVFFYPLAISMIGFGLMFVVLVLLRTRTEIRARRLQALLARERASA